VYSFWNGGDRACPRENSFMQMVFLTLGESCYDASIDKGKAKIELVDVAEDLALALLC
jgi:hypothetical protein